MSFVHTETRAMRRRLASVTLLLLAMVAVLVLGLVRRMIGREEQRLAIESKSRFIRGVTHDIKNPLGAANGFAELLADGMAAH
jgi:signal transduction histidine kinase